MLPLLPWTFPCKAKNSNLSVLKLKCRSCLPEPASQWPSCSLCGSNPRRQQKQCEGTGRDSQEGLRCIHIATWSSFKSRIEVEFSDDLATSWGLPKGLSPEYTSAKSAERDNPPHRQLRSLGATLRLWRQGSNQKPCFVKFLACAEEL